MDKKYDTSSPKRKAPRSSRGGCARKCHVLESMWHFFRFEQVAVCDLKLQEQQKESNDFRRLLLRIAKIAITVFRIFIGRILLCQHIGKNLSEFRVLLDLSNQSRDIRG